MDQGSLFETRPPSAFSSRTSNEAAKAMDLGGGHMTIQQWVHHILSCAPRTDEDIARVINMSKDKLYRLSSVISARNSLCKQTKSRGPLVRDSGRTRKSPTSGCMATIWEVI